MPPEPTGTIAINEPGPYHYGDTLTFTCSDNLKGRKYPMVAVHLFQDANEDGTVSDDPNSEDLVWVQLNHPETPVILGGGGSGLDASKSSKGRASLYAYSWKVGQESIVLLDSVQFDVVV
jgi:hypothetical protein